ncbi:DUF6934 family protein [Dyadobacter sp. NIV53]|uniref:DUF6934 family protein n=1 Tax=Dyadobacter sp. NIV53 TaxID=2861765 RepID=UPI001C873EBF|nr:hypothetical protein [Dyadobacter sp. NIV53]
MNENTYPFTLSRTEFRFEFVSISAKKEVRKVVLLTETAISKIYNLALLDLLENGELSDMAETSNDDFKIVIATVIQIINNFLDHNHHIFVIFSGSDSRRHRLYRIILSRELIEISKKFVVFGVNHDVPYPFEINTEYEFCLIGKHENTKKKILL